MLCNGCVIDRLNQLIFIESN